MPINRTYSFDIDTKKYLNRVNTFRGLNGLSNIAVADAVDIDNFVVGLKDMGIWGNVVFWMLSSRHNAGLGINVLSLGGAGIYDGIMKFSSGGFPTWNTNGILFNNNQWIQTNVPTNTFFTYRGIGCVGVADWSQQTVSNNCMYFGTRTLFGVSPSPQGISIGNAGGSLRVKVNTDVVDSNTTATRPTGYSFAGAVASSSGVTSIIVDNTITTLGSIVSPPGVVTAAAWNVALGGGGDSNAAPQQNWIGNVSFGMFVSGPIAVASSLRPLYRTTIGKGLGLV